MVYRDGRAFSVGQATSFGGGVSSAQAQVAGDAALAFGSAGGAGGAQLARDGYYYPGQALAQAQSYDAPPFPESAYGAAKAQAHNGAYYPVPAPATVITYEQNFAPASSVAHTESHGGGVAHSSANTRAGPGYGATSSNADSRGEGVADSNANAGFGGISSSAKTHGEGSASSSAQNNGVVGVVYPAAPAPLPEQPAPSVFDLKTPIFYTSYVPAAPAQGVASANANVVGSGQAASSAKVGHQGRTISWRFGTLYDSPAAAHAQANTHGYGSANANAGVNGQGSAKSIADAQSGLGVAQSSANSHGAGSANANANVNGYGGARSAANVQGQYYGGSRSSASARTQGVNTAFRVTNSQANSSGFGSAQANAQAA